MFQCVFVHESFCFGNGLLAVSSRSVSVAGGMKSWFKYGLDDPVSHGGYSQRSGAAVGFRYFHTSDWAWFIRSGFEFQMKSIGVFMELFPIGLDGFSIDSGGSFVFLHLLVGLNQILFAVDFVHEAVVFLHLSLLFCIVPFRLSGSSVGLLRFLPQRL